VGFLYLVGGEALLLLLGIHRSADKLALIYQIDSGCPVLFCRAVRSSTFSGIGSRATVYFCVFTFAELRASRSSFRRTRRDLSFSHLGRVLGEESSRRTKVNELVIFANRSLAKKIRPYTQGASLQTHDYFFFCKDSFTNPAFFCALLGRLRPVGR
jgi:hypothetical protein